MTYPSTHSCDGSMLATFDGHDAAATAARLRAAHDCCTRDGRQRSLADRSVVLRRAAAPMPERRDELARPVTVERGNLPAHSAANKATQHAKNAQHRRHAPHAEPAEVSVWFVTARTTGCGLPGSIRAGSAPAGPAGRSANASRHPIGDHDVSAGQLGLAMRAPSGKQPSDPVRGVEAVAGGADFPKEMA